MVCTYKEKRVREDPTCCEIWQQEQLIAVVKVLLSVLPLLPLAHVPLPEVERRGLLVSVARVRPRRSRREVLRERLGPDRAPLAQRLPDERLAHLVVTPGRGFSAGAGTGAVEPDPGLADGTAAAAGVARTSCVPTHSKCAVAVWMSTAEVSARLGRRGRHGSRARGHKTVQRPGTVVRWNATARAAGRRGGMLMF